MIEGWYGSDHLILFDEAEIVSAYFGLDGENGVTIEQIGQKYDLTKERIRQIKERAIKRLQKARYSGSLKAYLG